MFRVLGVPDFLGRTLAAEVHHSPRTGPCLFQGFSASSAPTDTSRNWETTLLISPCRGLRDMPGRKSVLLFSQNMTSEMIGPVAQRLIDAANRAAAVIDPIDPRGVLNPNELMRVGRHTSPVAVTETIMQREVRMTESRHRQRCYRPSPGGSAYRPSRHAGNSSTGSIGDSISPAKSGPCLRSARRPRCREYTKNPIFTSGSRLPPATSRTIQLDPLAWNHHENACVKTRMLLRLASLAFLTSSAFAQTLFPPGALPDAVAQRYTEFLQALHEPSLFELAGRDHGAEAYRLLWLRDDDRPASVRFVIKPGGTGWFYRRMAGGTGATRPSGLHEYGMSWSWRSRTASFLRTVDDAGFWSAAAEIPNASGLCRSHWVLEGVQHGQYRVIDRCSPDENDPVRIVGLRLMQLAHLRVHGRHVY